MAFDNAQKFISLGMPFPLAKQVGEAIDNSTQTPAVLAVTPLTNSTGGTANDTVQAVPQATAATDVTAASLTSTNAALTIINNDMADLTVKVNAILAALQG